MWNLYNVNSIAHMPTLPSSIASSFSFATRFAFSSLLRRDSAALWIAAAFNSACFALLMAGDEGTDVTWLWRDFGLGVYGLPPRTLLLKVLYFPFCADLGVPLSARSSTGCPSKLKVSFEP